MKSFVSAAAFVLLVMLEPCTPPDAATQVDALFEAYAGADTPGLSVLVIKNGEVRYRKAFGMANLEEAESATPATNYRLASVTKQFTAMATLMLVEEGRLSLDTRLTELFPDFPPYGHAVAVRHLLSHTSGLLDYEDLIPDSATVQVRDRDVLASMTRQDSTYFEPGSRFRYSNTGYALLAMIVETVSGQRFADFLHDRLFVPLGMTGTVAFEEGVSTVSHRAYGYTQAGASFVRNDQSLTSAVLGDGGIYSSVDDLYAWHRALDGGKLVRPGLMEQVFMPAENTQHDGAGYGYGWFVGRYDGRASVWHTGSTVGFRNAVERFPRERLTVIVLSNRDTEVHDLLRRVADVFLAEPS
ncbi:MAG: serine hydrolase domain-containing protein [Rhodothermales bacterium]